MRDGTPDKSLVDLDAAWDEPHAATPPDWFVGTPVYRVEQRQWALYAFDTTERAHSGKRTREWTAVGDSEVAVVREMARCLREIGEDRVPK